MVILTLLLFAANSSWPGLAPETVTITKIQAKILAQQNPNTPMHYTITTTCAATSCTHFDYIYVMMSVITLCIMAQSL